jgi:Mitochondrial 39-S ribosomal protein L47 (MRP-L47)
LRGKSFEDLHKLWFVCLVERNRLLTERLFYKQEGRHMPDGVRLTKVRKTMSRIKAVLGERERAVEAVVAQSAAPIPPKRTKREAEAVPQELTVVKKFGRSHLVGARHPIALRPTRAELRTRHAAIRRFTRWSARQQLRLSQRAEVPAHVRRWIGENLARADTETAMEAATLDVDTRFDTPTTPTSPNPRA